MSQFDLVKALTLVGLAGGVYLCYLTSGVFHQKLLKHSYQSTTGQFERMTDGMVLSFYPTLAATIIGFFATSCQKQSVHIPVKQSLIVAMILVINQYTYNQAVVYASFPSVVMVKSCSLLSVILVAVFCSRVKDQKLKIGPQKIIIGVLACTGIVLFNYFANSAQNNEADHPISGISTVLLLVSLVGDGFLPDFQANIKATFKPSSYDMFYNINKWTFLCCVIIQAIRLQLINVVMFAVNHPLFGRDVIIFSSINGIGQIFIYELIKRYKQHIPAFVITFRKCLTVIINILWFGHELNLPQLIGLILVFVAIGAEVYANNCTKKQEQKQGVQTILQFDNNLDETQKILSKIDDQLKESENHVDQPQKDNFRYKKSNSTNFDDQQIKRYRDIIQDQIQRQLMEVRKCKHNTV